MKWILLVMACATSPVFANVASVDYVTRRDGATVHKTGDKTISGVKTFNDVPMIPTAPLPALS